MMTQLKSYLLQSAELQAMLEPQHQYVQDKLGNFKTMFFMFFFTVFLFFFQLNLRIQLKVSHGTSCKEIL